MTTTTTTIRIDARRYEDQDDCLSAAQADYAAEHGLEGWDLEARWEDDQRDAILLTVPAAATLLANEQPPAGYTVYHADEAGLPRAHEPGHWYYAPTDSDADSGLVWSEGYATWRDAVEACRAEALRPQADMENDR